MKNIISKYSIAALTALTLSLGLTACDTDTEPLGINEASIEAQNPELYQQYLDNLRQYKQSAHKLVYVWFDNSNKVPTGRANHITDLPDSVDVVSLNHPDGLADWELADINKVREEKGTKVIYTIDFDAIKAAYNAKLELATEEEPVSIDFEGFLVESLEKAVSFVDKYGYDGLCIAYTGKSRRHMLPNELKEYTANERIFINLMADWKSRHTDKLIAFLGNPQNLIDPALTKDCASVLLSGTEAKDTDRLSFILAQSIAEGVPAEKYGMVVSNFSLKDPNKSIGYLGDGRLAVEGLAEWAPAPHSGITMSAVGVLNVQDDYFYPTDVYHHVRILIQSLNPSVR